MNRSSTPGSALHNARKTWGARSCALFFPDQHRSFFEALPFAVIGTVDQAGRSWASILSGAPGFVRTPDDRTMKIAALPVEGDPAHEGLVTDAPMSLPGLEPSTRRRNRANLRVTRRSDTGLDLRLVMSFGNCPQYIQARDSEWSGKAPKVVRTELPGIDAGVAALIRQSDTFFVASHNPQEDPDTVGGVDINHRGGKPGFVKVDGNTLTIPDFKGNNAFNTLGNFLVNPQAGLLFADFETGDLIQITGTAELLCDMTPEIAGFEGAQRAWRVSFGSGHKLHGALNATWQFDSAARELAHTGHWT